ncbi:MAG: competence protein ComK [Bacillota bacterium]|uniref:Competence protein ComK n=1 Tax=Virgibacillus salarius TaxID=447199 RepID=A0A941DU89_9BACI|nr:MULTISPECIES: competence protein ComK [Virgibacillus]NAZ10059.1 competence protein [Agaribacter marinus]MBR7797349.1 competence protein ComK [Virgibacillus salarius]MCC2250833.1 competence protein ComK [Virgibacillus sp. AGTR]MDY7046325.1 competence protein ComK [Virgibacillus sp. M23]QRZ16492.1 competence protein ComK [Virgibacillus sp. AGTR]
MLNLYTSTPEITPLTVALVAQRDSKDNPITMVLEEEAEYPVSFSPSKIVDHACKFFGASLKGRQEGTKDICGITHKAPITIDPISGMYFFPTTSPSSSKCSWIAHSHIDQVLKAANYGTEILFKNGKRVFLDISYGSALNQVQRTAQFRYLLDNRIRFLQKHIDRTAPFPLIPQE